MECFDPPSEHLRCNRSRCVLNSVRNVTSSGMNAGHARHTNIDRLKVGGGVPREQKILKGHLPRVIYHQVYLYTKIKRRPRFTLSGWRETLHVTALLSDFAPSL